MNKVFIATSLDGFIAKKDGDIEWLHSIPNPDNSDYGYSEFMKTVDALIMGRKTFEKVISFGIEFPYEKKVFVLSSTLKNIPKGLEGKIEIVSGNLSDIMDSIRSQSYHNLYIDGALTIRSFLKKNMIDSMIITRIPITLNEGISLFDSEAYKKSFILDSTKVFRNGIRQEYYIKKDTIDNH